MATLYASFTATNADWTTNTSFRNSSTGATAAPASGDTILFDSRATGYLTAGLSQTSLTNMTLIFDQSFAGRVGVADVATAVGTYLAIGAPTIRIGGSSGEGSPTGSALIMIDVGTTPSTITCLNSSSTSADTYLPPIRIIGSAPDMRVTGGSVCVAPRQGESSTGTFKVSSGGGSSNAYLFLGPGVSVTSLTVDGGECVSVSTATCTAATVEGGTYDYLGTGAHTTLNVRDGVCYYSGTGTITTANVHGTLDFSRSPAGRTVTNCTVYGGGTLNFDNGTPGGIVFTNPIQFPDGINSISLTGPKNIKFAPVTI